MKALYFTKIDYLSTKVQMKIFPFMALLFAVLLIGNRREERSGAVVMVGLLYMMFAAVTISTTPFGAGRSIDVRFLMTLPANAVSRVAGRFLYGLSLLGISLVFAAVIAAVCRNLPGVGFAAADMALSLLVLEAAVILVALEYTVLYLIGEVRGPYVLNIIKVVPAMCFFFGGMEATEALPRGADGALLFSGEIVGILQRTAGYGALLSLILLCGAVCLCARAMRRRDY